MARTSSAKEPVQQKLPVRIDRFVGEHGFLDNFYIEPDGTHVEGEFQSKKNLSREHEFKGLGPSTAKILGNSIPLRADWEQVKDQVMYFFVWKKFNDHPTLAEKLLATGEAILIEGNFHGDRIWGTVNGEGENRLGRILMQVREELRVAQNECRTKTKKRKLKSQLQQIS